MAMDNELNSPEEEIHLRDYLKVIQKRKWTIISFFAILVITVTISTLKARPVYRATVQLLIEKENPNVVEFRQVMEVNSVDLDYYQTQYKILESRSLAKQVIDTLHLKDHPEFAPKPQEKGWSPLSLLTHLSSLLQPAKPHPGGAVAINSIRESRLIDTFLARLKVEPVRSSRLVKVSYQGYDPTLITDISNTLARLYIEQSLHNKFSASQEATSWLSRELTGLKKKMETSQIALQRYKAQHSIVSLTPLEDGGQGGGENIVAQKLAELTSELTKARTERIGLETLYRQVQGLSARPEMIESVSAVNNNALIKDLKTQYVRLIGEFSELSKKYGEKHPRMIQLDTELETIREKISLEVKKVAKGIEIEYQVARSREETLRQALEEQKQEATDLNQKSIEYSILKREADSNQQLYDSLLKRMKEATLTTELKTSNIRIVDPAEIPERPIKPKKQLNILLAMITGLMLGVGLAFFFEYLDNTVKTPEEVERYLGIPFLGPVGRFKTNGKSTGSELVVLEDPRSNIAEGLRNIRTNLLFASPEVSQKVLMVTSSAASEGKTVVIANLAAVLAQTGKRVLLIDADLRKPRINRVFGLPREPGLSNLLIGEATLDSVLQKTEVESLQVIPAGPIPPNPSELLGLPKLERIIQEARERFDIILFDSPPVMSVTDPLVLASRLDGVVLVVRGGHTPRDPIRRVISQLSDVNAKMLGVVLNNIDFRKERYYYQYYYRYYYSYYEEDRSNGKQKRRHKTAKSAKE
ncbi:MAG: polysaccharide biosynthesis tyrosine autokinase [Candidatus Tectomicrobia bacterium]|uniref:non-specific protein-tyrosine kinase n=1 Tax=Tectimicrobiota bacterium TaxID=2528274 RepID=A0A932CP19_UNCTE|nr:polysaccharide biosynthesis tyrosine autokinase [Candidatus Tectomicrobia bacterium]